MENIIVKPKNRDELNYISKYLQENKISFVMEDEYKFQARMKARKKLAKLVESSPKIDITDEEIDSIVDEVRAKRYQEKNSH